MLSGVIQIEILKVNRMISASISINIPADLKLKIIEWFSYGLTDFTMNRKKFVKRIFNHERFEQAKRFGSCYYISGDVSELSKAMSWSSKKTYSEYYCQCMKYFI